MDGITWEHFLRDIKVIHEISQQIGDNWRLERKVIYILILYINQDVISMVLSLFYVEYEERQCRWNMFGEKLGNFYPNNKI